MSVSLDLIIAERISFDDLSRFLIETCELTVDIKDSTAFFCEEFYCFLDECTEIRKEIIEREFGFTPTWEISFYYQRNCDNPNRTIRDTMLLVMIEYSSDCTWLINGESPQLIRRAGKLTLQGNHSPYSAASVELVRIAQELGLPYEVKPIG